MRHSSDTCLGGKLEIRQLLVGRSVSAYEFGILYDGEGRSCNAVLCQRKTGGGGSNPPQGTAEPLERRYRLSKTNAGSNPVGVRKDLVMHLWYGAASYLFTLLRNLASIARANMERHKNAWFEST